MNTKLATTIAGTMVAAASTLAARAEAAPKTGKAAAIARGRYLVDFGGCHDCHTPWKMGASGPEPDMARALSGHPESLVMPPAPALPPGPWVMGVGATMTAWSGPWGVSFTANLTPDRETGIGQWTLANFVETIRTGRHLGKGRPLLPPMPYFNVAKLSDADLSAVFAYLQSLPPIKNRVPQPIPPPTTTAAVK